MKRQCFNPYLPSWEYIPDAEPRLFDGRVYIYGSHDRFGSKEYCVNDYVSWSAPEDDLSDWRYEGIIFRKDQTPWNTKNLLYYAPDVVQGTDGKYYLFYSVQNSSIASVAVCDTPAGKFEYLGDVHFPDGRVYGSNPEDWFLFDPAVLVDDDGRIYLYAGSGQPSNGNFGHEIKGLFVMELSSDMLTIIGETTIILPADFNPKRPNYWEGPSIRHIGKWYYLVYPATDITGLNYAMSLFPDKGFSHKGPIHSSSDIGLNGRKLMNAAYPMGNSHGGMVCVKGQWYIFDHRRTGNMNWTAIWSQAAAPSFAMGNGILGACSFEDAEERRVRLLKEAGFNFSYDSNGKEISRTSMTTAGKETRLQIIPEKLSLRPNSQDLCYVNIDLVGTDGVTKSTEDVPITVTVSGAGSLLALGSAKPNMGECFFADTHTTYYGKALAVIRTGNECGKIHIKASAPNLEDQFIELEVRE